MPTRPRGARDQGMSTGSSETRKQPQVAGSSQPSHLAQTASDVNALPRTWNWALKTPPLSCNFKSV